VVSGKTVSVCIQSRVQVDQIRTLFWENVSYLIIPRMYWFSCRSLLHSCVPKFHKVVIKNLSKVYERGFIIINWGQVVTYIILIFLICFRWVFKWIVRRSMRRWTTTKQQQPEQGESISEVTLRGKPTTTTTCSIENNFSSINDSCGHDDEYYFNDDAHLHDEEQRDKMNLDRQSWPSLISLEVLCGVELA